MNNLTVKDRYRELLSNIEGMSTKDVETYSRELYRRNRHGWTIPISTYRRCKDLLLYKESLERHSPYYVDLLRIEDRNNLKIVLSDICKTIRVTEHTI